MNYTQRVCTSLYCSTNIISEEYTAIRSLYSLVDREKKNDPTYFILLQKIVNRSVGLSRDYQSFVTCANKLLTRAKQIKTNKWGHIAYMIFVIDLLEEIAINNLENEDRKKFGDNLPAILFDHIQEKYCLLKSDWITFI